MTSKILKTYLNDHLAGSVAALELLDHLITLYRGTERETSFAGLRAEVEEDQKVLHQLLEKVGGKESPVRKVAAWVTEKLGEAKLRLDDPGNGHLRELEALETLELGIQGKLSLWQALASVAELTPPLRSVDYGRLEQRAIEQFKRVDVERLRAARAALVG